MREPVSLLWPSSPSSSTRTRAWLRDDRSFKAVDAQEEQGFISDDWRDRAEYWAQKEASHQISKVVVCRRVGGHRVWTLAPSTEPSSRNTSGS